MAKSYLNRLDDEIKKKVENQGPIPSLKAPMMAVTQEMIQKSNSSRPQSSIRERNVLPGSAEVKVNKQKSEDEKLIREYEAMPDYGINRTANVKLYKNGEYVGSDIYDNANKKQSMVNEYNAAKQRQISDALDRYTGNADIPMLAGAGVNATLHPFQYAQAQNDILPYLQQNNITLDQLADYYGAQAMTEQNKKAKAYAEEHPVLSFLSRPVTNVLTSGISGLDALSSYAQGKPIGSNQTINAYGQLTPTISNTIREGIDNPIGKTAYDVANAVGDMGMSLALGGGNQLATLGLMSFNAGANTLNEQKDKNTTADQKIAMGLASGLIEAATEAIPLDNLFRLAKNTGGRQTIKQIMKNVLKQAGQEATEEAVSEVANAFADNLINGEQSDYANAVTGYMATGMSEDEAKRKAMGDIALNAGYSALVGGLTGGIMGGGASVVGNARYNASRFAPEIDSNYSEYVNNQRGSDAEGGDIRRLPALETGNTNGMNQLMLNNELGLDDSMRMFQNSNNESNIPWIDQEVEIPRGNTPAERIRSMTGFEHDISGIMANEIAPTAEQQNIPSLDADTSAELNELNNQYNRFMNQYQQNNDPIALKVAEAIQTRINNIVGNQQTNSIPTMNEQTQNAPEVEIDIPQIQEQKPKRQRDTVMKEDYGLNPRTTMEEDADLDGDGDELVIDLGMSDDDANAVSQFGTNSLMNNIAQTEEQRAKVQEGIEAGDYNKAENATNKVDVLHNEDTEEQADDLINNHRSLLDNRIRRGDATDPIVFEAVLKLTEDAMNKGDWDSARYYSMKAAGQSTDSGRILQLLAKRAKIDASTAIQKADVLIDELTDNFMNRKQNRKKREGCAKLATALRNIGNDHTNDSAKVPKTYAQIRNGVIAELNRESSSVSDLFNDTDIDYMARMVERGYTTDEIQYKLEEKLATGSWEISDADLQEVTRLFDAADKAGVKTKAGIDLQEQAYAILAKYLPDTTFMDKWNAWRYLAMLGNTRTHIRNIIGNKMFGTVTNIKDGLAGVLESAFVRNGERTKTAFRPTDAELLKASLADADNVWGDLTEGGNKYNMTHEIENQRKVFKNKWLEGIRKFNNDMLTKEDNMALRKKYRRALAGYLQANGKNASIFNSADPSDTALLEKAREYAIKEAKIATFHEENSLANTLNKLSKEALAPGSTFGQKALGYTVEALIPFKKTPANILKQGAVAYNPLQVVNGFYDAIANGDNMSKAMDELARGLTGSGIMALGYMLAQSGILRPSAKDDEDLDKLTGEQAYSIKLGNDTSYTVDWAAPAALPLFVGAELYKTYEDREDFDFWSALSSVTDPVIEMSMLQGLKNSLESAASFTSGKNTFGDVIINTGYNYASQGIPTISGQIARSVDDTRRSTYTGKQGTMDTIMRNVKKTQNKIPGLSMMNEPYVDAWGETQANGSIPFLGNNMASRLAYNMLSPGYISDTSKSPTEQELYRLNDKMQSGEIEKKKIIPSVADKSYEGQRLSPQDYTKISLAKGQTLQNLYAEALRDPRYREMSDESKADLLDTLSKFGNALSKSEVFGYDIAGSDTYKKKYEAYEHGGVSGLITYMDIKDGREGSSVGSTLDAIESLDISDQDKVYYFKQFKPDYSVKAQYLDGINEKYAYDWYKIRTQYGTKNDEMLYGIYVSDLPDLEKQILAGVLEMKDDEVQYHLTTGQ